MSVRSPSAPAALHASVSERALTLLEEVCAVVDGTGDGGGKLGRALECIARRLDRNRGAFPRWNQAPTTSTGKSPAGSKPRVWRGDAV